MDAKEIQELLKLINRLELAEFKYKQGDVQFSVKSKFYYGARSMGDSGVPYAPLITQTPSIPIPPPVVSSAPVVSAPAETESETKAPATPAAGKNNLVEIRSPIVGTFYRSSSPDKPPYAKPGDKIEVGNVVCIIEAMKLFNEIESEVAGKVVKVLVEDATPVEYDQLLFLIDPNG